ncbi:MAG: hypothetical protein GY765_02865 [bacterium]|nr:hypothetical protein [bacterium]
MKYVQGDTFTYGDANDLLTLGFSKADAMGQYECRVKQVGDKYRLYINDGVHDQFVSEMTADEIYAALITTGKVISLTETGASLDKSDGDISDIPTTGFYRGDNMTNAPSTAWHHIVNFVHSSTWKGQIASRYHENDIRSRVLINEAWGPWERLLTAGAIGLPEGARMQAGKVFSNAAGYPSVFSQVFSDVPIVFLVSPENNLTKASYTALSASGFTLNTEIDCMCSYMAIGV